MNKHPDQELLQAYACGEIDAVMGLVVALHITQCSACRAQVHQLENELASQFEMASDFAFSGGDEECLALEAMLDGITDLPLMRSEIRIAEPRDVKVNGRSFPLPKPLWPFADKLSEWRSYGGKVFSAEVMLEETARVNLIYIGENVRIPQHTHKGKEATLVLHGGFSDESGHYTAGDLLERDGRHKHSPFTAEGEECLCLTVLTEPMLFTGVARVFNRFGKGMYP
ncbi:transcriptional regulator [Vibrio sp. SM6]|uniref:Transcriptional regulator n=1 Tax=Vibrio agarilyticus TaxID=2726741 RepID=A0A7X8YH14_9VIBR|nr:ChrR family anti-sigma-E factor [Vibrio agarilyticus]NLS13120.1 transcriptional regulator [Vibrio agarilyticus]